MAHVNNLNSLFVKSEADIFGSKPLQNTIDDSKIIAYRPVNIISNDMIEFEVPGSDLYPDMSSTTIHFKYQIYNETKKERVVNKMDKTDPTKPVRVNPFIFLINNFQDSHIKHVSVELNLRSITTSDNRYQYRSYFEKLLNYSEDAKKTHLGTSLFGIDDHTDMTTCEGEGFKRRNHYLDLETFETSGYLHTELSGQNKLILNNVDIKIKIYLNAPEFSLYATTTTTDKYRIDILDTKLCVRKVRVNANTVASHQLTLQKDLLARYPVNRISVKTFSLGTDTVEKSIENLYLGILPTRIFVGLTEEDCGIRKNPYNFQHFNFSSIQLSSDVHTYIPPIVCNFDRGEYLEAYNSLIQTCGIHFADKGNCISRENFCSGNCLVGFNFNVDASSNPNYQSLTKAGSMRLEIKFARKLTIPIQIVVYAEFDGTVTINKNREVNCDYTC